MKAEFSDTSLRFGGIAGAELPQESYALGEGIELRRTFSHLFSVNMMAFARPRGSGEPHPAPWKAAEGGFGTDIEVELTVPERTSLGELLNPAGTIWWITALLRLAKYPYLSVPVLSNRPFHEMKDAEDKPTLIPFEIEPRIFRSTSAATQTLETEVLDWVADNWARAGKLLGANAKFHAALRSITSPPQRWRPGSYPSSPPSESSFSDSSIWRSRMFRNSIFIAGPACNWSAIRPDLAACFLSWSVTSITTWSLIIWTR